MPLPIQSAGITDQLRRLFRLRGRTKFQLDETVVPVVQLRDLSPALDQTPASGSIIWSSPALGGGQVALLLNPDGATLQLLLDPVAFDGRTWTSEQAQLLNRSVGFLADVRVHIVSRNNVLAPGPPTSIVQLVETRENATGLRRVPVVMAGFAAGGVAFDPLQTIDRFDLPTAAGAGGLRFLPPFTIGPDEAILVTSSSAVAASLFLRAHGAYNPQPR